ncbi:MAG: hypothetical protein AAF630_13155 [Cyanobacteria bacterium P01_C01_bin.38]
MPNAPSPMPHPQCPIPNPQLPTTNYQSPIPIELYKLNGNKRYTSLLCKKSS